MENDVLKVEIGQQLPPERWLVAADNLEQVFPAIAQRLLLINNEGRADGMLALIAMRYVGNFAHDKCRFIPIPDEP